MTPPPQPAHSEPGQPESGQPVRVTHEQVIAGQAVYTRRTLSAYDLIVLGVSNRLIWRCPTPALLSLYNDHISTNHLDVGVGTGYYLDHCRFPPGMPRVALMDLNRDALQYAANRVLRYSPETYQCNVLEPVTSKIKPFDSIGLNYLLHCVPGAMSEKAIAIDHLQTLMRPGAVLFGSTLLQGGVKSNWAARKLMKIYNKKGIFCNEQDSLDSLQDALNSRFDDVRIEVMGCAALFYAKNPTSLP